MKKSVAYKIRRVCGNSLIVMCIKVRFLVYYTETFLTGKNSTKC